VLQLLLVFLIHFLFVHVPGRRLVQLIPADGTRSDLKLSTAAPRGLLFSREVTANSVTMALLLYCFRTERTLESQCISLSDDGWHECASHSKAYETHLPIVGVILLTKVCGKVEC
jgi:hypothetical protein